MSENGVRLPVAPSRQVDYSRKVTFYFEGQPLEAFAGETVAMALFAAGRRIFEAALSGGAQALQHPVGRIAPGYRADIVVLDETHPQLAGRSGDAILDSWIFSGGNVLVKDVYVAGRRVIADGHHADEDRIARNFRKTVKRLSA